MELNFKFLKIFVTIVASMSFSVQSDNITTLDRQMCVGRMDGFLFHDSQNCQAFIECQRQMPNRRICSTGTLFNIDLYYCTAAHIVNCNNRPKPDRQNESSNNNFQSPLETHHSVSFITKKPSDKFH